MGRTGECASHSPGFVGGATLTASSLETSMPMASAVTAVAGPGADDIAMMTEISKSTAVITIDCHRKIVSENGMTPVIGNSGFGRLAAFACNCAADNASPIAHVRPDPRKAAPAAAGES